MQFVDQSVGAEGIKCRAEVNKQHPDVCLNVAEGGVEGDGADIICGSIGHVGELMLVKARWDVGLGILQHQSLHTFHDYGCRGHRSVIIQPCDGRGFGHRDYGGGF